MVSKTQKHVLITGTNRGIGLGLVKAYLNDGWRVSACCRSPEDAIELTSLMELDDDLAVYGLDVTNYDEIQGLASALEGVPLDLLINNAGYYGPKGVSFGNTNVSEWEKVFAVNTIAPQKMAEAFHPNLCLADTACIANMSSKVGSMEDNHSGGGYLYRSSKSALNSVTKSQSLDLAEDDIIVVALHPGWVLTDMGGPNALIDIEASVIGLKRILDTISPLNTGEFMDFSGQKIPW